MKYASFLLLLISCGCLSQTSTGVINYGEVQSLGMGGIYGYDYNAILLFNNEESLYITRKDSLENNKINKQMEVSNNNGARRFTVATNEEGFKYFYDKSKDILIARDIGFRYVIDKKNKIDWKIENETKKIGDFICSKATAKFRGRNYTAWFTTEIPLPYGPWKLKGLPGIILEAYDEKKRNLLVL